MDQDTVDLAVEGARLHEAGSRPSDAYVALSLAAATAFHQAHGEARGVVARRDYDDALNIAAAALSRLLPIFTTSVGPERHTRVAVDLLSQRFTHGATQLMARDGDTLADLSVQGSDLESAVSLIRRAGLPFSFMFVAVPEARAAGMQDVIDVAAEERKVRAALANLLDAPIPLSLAAACLFHETHHASGAPMTRGDYLHALEAATQALSKQMTGEHFTVSAAELHAAIEARRGPASI